jgi:subtilisin family serine protease
MVLKIAASFALLPMVALLVWMLRSWQRSVSTGDEEQTKVIAGVPVFNYHQRHYLSDAVSAGRRLRSPRRALGKRSTDWVFMLNASDVTDEVTQSVCDSLGAGACLGAGHPTHGGAAFAVLRATDTELEEVLKKHGSKVGFVEPDAPMSAEPVVDDEPEMHLQGVASWGIDRIDDRKGLDGTYTGAANGGNGVHVYVADTGIRTTHQDFGGRAIPTLEVLGNGVRECSAWDRNCARDFNGHGTHCAGTIGGNRYGVARGVSIHAVQVLDDDGRGSLSWFVEALDWVVVHGQKPAVFSASLGASGTKQFVDTAIQSAVRAGVTVVVAAGNDGSNACNYSPSFVPSAITVGASTSADSMASYSNQGSCVDIQAPGSSIISASHRSDSGSTTMSGTSMAAPHVAGAAALLLQADNFASPDQIASQLKAQSTKGALTNIFRWWYGGSPNELLYVDTSENAMVSGTSVYLLAHTGKHIEVTSWWAWWVGGGSVGARWFDRGNWQQFVIESSSGRAIYSGDQVFLKAHTGYFLDSEAQSKPVQARSSDRGTWQTFIIEKNGDGAIMPGDRIHLRTHHGHHIDVQGTTVSAQWSDRGRYQGLVIERASDFR